MKNLLISTALLTATSTMAFADEQKFMTEADPMAIQASDFIGQNIYSTESGVENTSSNGVQDGWENIGEVHDIVLTRDGKIQSVLVDIGGFLGIGERQIAVDMNALKLVSDSATEQDDADYFLVMQANVSEFEDAPAYEHTAANDLTNSVEQAAENTAAAAKETAADVKASAETAAAELGDAAENTSEDVQQMADEATDGDMAREPMMREGYAQLDSNDLTTEMLTGARTYDTKDEWIGEVSELVLNDKGELTHAIVDVGGFLGIGEKPVKLDLNKLDILHETDGNDVRVYLPMTEDKLKSMEAYEG